MSYALFVWLPVTLFFGIPLALSVYVFMWVRMAIAMSESIFPHAWRMRGMNAIKDGVHKRLTCYDPENPLKGGL